jgi:hypothetical protein
VVSVRFPVVALTTAFHRVYDHGNNMPIAQLASLARYFDFPALAESLQVFAIDDSLARPKTISCKVTATDEVSGEGLGNAELLCGLTHR